MPHPRAAHALAIRDHVLPLIRERGALQSIGIVRIVTVVAWEAKPLLFTLRTPFSGGPKEGPAPSYQHALLRQQAKAVLPYGLDVWHRGRKVMSLEWSGAGESNLIRFMAGEWEAEVLALA